MTRPKLYPTHRPDMTRRTPAPERFWSKVQGDDYCDCWTWVAFIRSDGYGMFWAPSQRMIIAHLWSYQFMVGPIPDGLELDHLCRNRACVNPWHLDPVTPKVNSQRAEPAQRTHCPHGHEYTPENTRLEDGRRRCRTCRRQYDREWECKRPPRPRRGQKVAA